MFFLRIVTFWKRIDSRGRTKGEREVLSENISSETCREGLAQEGVETGLWGGEETSGGLGLGKGGKLESLNKEGITE